MPHTTEKGRHLHDMSKRISGPQGRFGKSEERKVYLAVVANDTTTPQSVLPQPSHCSTGAKPGEVSIANNIEVALIPTYGQ